MLDPKQRQRLLRDNRARLGIGIVVVMAVAALLAPLIARQSPITIDLLHILQRPSAQHWLGTDIQGRDIWSRLVYGARVSLTVGLISQGIALALGVTMGLIAGFYGRWI
ncbi:MAG: ABC transporter permease, partial [Gemmatimonadaceae bacterium]